MKRRTAWLAVCVLACLLNPSFRRILADDTIAPAEALATADQLCLSGNYAEAAEQYAQVAAARPVDAALGLARCQESTGRREQAADTLSAALEDHPREAALHAELARLAFERGDYETADAAVTVALGIDEDQLQARWIAAQLLTAAGKLDEADRAHKWLVDYYNQQVAVTDPEDMQWIGLAAAQFARWNRLGDQFKFLVNELYPDALNAEPAYWRAHLDAGRLFLEKYNQADASRELRAALRLNPQAAEVHAALGELAMQRFDMDDARRSILAALELNPQLLEAHQLKSDLAAANFHIDEAIEILDEALRLNPRSEETLARLAAAYVSRDGLSVDEDIDETPLGKLLAEVNARNPHAGVFYYRLAASLEQQRRFTAAERFFEEALERMPQLVGPRAGLGMLYMRLGEEDKARKLLDESFDVDRYNVRASNMLKVLEVLEDYAVLETEHFVIKFDRTQDELLARYAADYLENEVYPELTAKFGFEPAGKSLFEIFNRARNTDGHGWFSARMVGLPYIGTVGACAGKVVALASPGGMPKKYNWGRVLKHEFVHVLNLEQTNFNIPHWYTEALAVINEGYPRPQVWNDLLIQRVPRDELFNLDTINLGFVRPGSGLDWHMAYCQAELYAEYMLQTFGDDALAKMLDAYHDNLTTRVALRRSFDIEQEEFEAGYRDFLRTVVAGLSARPKPAEMSLGELERAVRDDPENPDLLARLAHEYVARRAYPKARKLAEQALEIAPGHQHATYVIARIHLVVGETQKAIELLAKCLDRESPQENALSLLAGMKLKAKAYDEAAELYALGAKHDPSADRWLSALAKVHLTAGNDRELFGVLEQLALRDTDDFTVRKKLAQLALAAEDFPAAARWASQAIQIDVQDADVHRQLAQALTGSQDYARAIEEYEVAVELAPDELALRLLLAETCVKADQQEKAQAALEELLNKDPDFPGAKPLLESIGP